MNIKVFKLISGEELISEVVNNLPTMKTLKEPAVIVMQKTEQGVGLGMMPYMPYVSGNVILSIHAIAAEGDPDVKLVNEYNRLFGSGIQIASAADLPVR
jgi:hypothetical protein